MARSTVRFNHSFETVDAAFYAVLERLNFTPIERTVMTSGSLNYTVRVKAGFVMTSPDEYPGYYIRFLPMSYSYGPTFDITVQLEIRKLGAEITQFSIRDLRRREDPDEKTILEARVLQEQLLNAEFYFRDLIDDELDTEFEVVAQSKLFFTTEDGTVFAQTVNETPAVALKILEGYLEQTGVFIQDEAGICEQLKFYKYPSFYEEISVGLIGAFSRIGEDKSENFALGAMVVTPTPSGSLVVLTCTNAIATSTFTQIGAHLRSTLSLVQEKEGPIERARHRCRYKLATCNKYIEIGKQVNRAGGSPAVAYDMFYKRKGAIGRVSLPTIKRAWSHYNEYLLELREAEHAKNDPP